MPDPIDLFPIIEALQLPEGVFFGSDHGEIVRYRILKTATATMRTMSILCERLGPFVPRNVLLQVPEPEALPFDPADDEPPAPAWAPVWPSPGEPLVCSYPGCGKVCATSLGLIAHTRRHGLEAHQAILAASRAAKRPVKKRGPKPRMQACVVCGQSIREPELLNHTIARHADQVLTCARCGRQFLPNATAQHQAHLKNQRCTAPAKETPLAPEVARGLRAMRMADAERERELHEHCDYCDGPCKTVMACAKRRRQAEQEERMKRKAA